jgi:hypothetical protein
VREPRAPRGGNHAAHGVDGGSGAAYGVCESSGTSLFQSGEEDGGAGDLKARWLDYSGSEGSENRALIYRSGAATNRLTSWKG